MRSLVAFACTFATLAAPPLARAGRAHDLLAHETDSVLLGWGYGDKSNSLSLMMRVWGVEASYSRADSYARRLEGIDLEATDDPLAVSSAWTVGVSPVTIGNWLDDPTHCRDESHCLEVVYAQPYAALKFSDVTRDGMSRSDTSLILGTRASFGDLVRIGAYAQVELAGPSEFSMFSAGLLFGTGTIHPDPGTEAKIPSPLRTALGFGAVVLIAGGLGLVFGFLDRECQENGGCTDQDRR